ncbi:MAG: ATP-dependent DNA helicase RecG, partial [Oscillospiraceae bacterium]|nr:ATP-dependent DNA helicase RecG [Oscillospiraceae bacterium]
RHPAKASQADFESRLPFQLTGAQKRVLKEAFHDMLEGEHPMNRLVQGDVGSGKTVVAAACCWLCGLSDMQSAVMAPTEILAEQHFQTFRALLEPFGMKVELLTGSMPAKEKRAVQARLASGETKVAVGTHALLSDAVSFQNLTLCVVDEQHRFGVLQRACLAHKGQEPHIMVMSATPIPRTLALMIYGDLDISVIDELPPGRQEIETYSVKEKMRTRIEAFARKQIEAGRQVYWICPMVEDKEEDAGLQSAEAKAEKLARQVFPDLRIGLLHGKMKPKEKNSVMQAFAAGELDILVATTVVEVGVDVPNANLIIIENADRFGLSQLHQLRGRVGRGRHASYCVLFDNGGNDVSAERLKVMTQTNNGFTIAETDLKLRGPGDFLGSRQHGLPEMKIASLADDMDLLYAASEAAELLLRADPKLTMENHSDIKRSTDALYAGFAGGMN